MAGAGLVAGGDGAGRYAMSMSPPIETVPPSAKPSSEMVGLMVISGVAGDRVERGQAPGGEMSGYLDRALACAGR